MDKPQAQIINFHEYLRRKAEAKKVFPIDMQLGLFQAPERISVIIGDKVCWIDAKTSNEKR